MGYRRVVEDMLEAYPDAAELRGGDGGTFVHAAAREKRSKVVALAIKKPMLRGLLDAQDRDGNTPLHLAVAAGAPAVAEALLRKGKVRADVLNNAGLTPFDLAAGGCPEQRRPHHGESSSIDTSIDHHGHDLLSNANSN